MRIVRVESWPVVMRLGEPYTIAYETVESTTNVFVRLVTDSSIVGVGCGAPDQIVTGESVDDVLTSLRTTAAPLLEGADPTRWAQPWWKLRNALRERPAARSAVDMAVFDILGRHIGLPLWRLWGGFRDSFETSVTIGILDENETVRRARDCVARGFRCLKLKGGLDVDCDIVRVGKVREAVGNAITLRFDANQGYALADAVRFMGSVESAGLELFEQPTTRDQPELLGQLAAHGSVPIMADECVLTTRDAMAIARGKLADVINVKLMKCGGVAEAIEIEAVTRSAGLACMVGSMDESALSIAAALAFALSRPNVQYADLDGHLGLADDPATPSFVLHEGRLFPSERPGLGVELKD